MARPVDTDELRPEYEMSDFPHPMERGRYAARLKQGSNVIVLSPEVATAFPNDEAVNKALLYLIELARKSASPKERSNRRRNRRAA
ncbi:MAG: hypothetical protein HY897_14600 [Deltaproteobacteria bacterium]|nr:hypothetical protein [Deltaproteobacteria bacterium]